MLEPGTIVYVLHFGDVETPSFTIFSTEEAALRDFFERVDQTIADTFIDEDYRTDEEAELLRTYRGFEPGDVDNRYRAALKVMDLVSDVARVEQRYVY